VSRSDHKRAPAGRAKPGSGGYTVLMLSGGLASTYALVQRLVDTDETLLVHHIQLVDDTGRHRPATDRARRIAEWCSRNIRRLDYSESRLDHSGLAYPGDDLCAVGSEAGIVARSTYKALNRVPDRWTIGWPGRAEAEREDVSETIAKTLLPCFEATCWPFDLAPFEAPQPVDRADMRAALPETLRAMTWSCDTPVRDQGTWSPCGVCPGCARDRGVPQRPRSPAHLSGVSLRPAAPTTLVVLSGGIDSVYVLAKMLKDTEDEVLAHHIHMANVEGRFAVEAARTREIVEWARRELRPVHYTESVVDRRGTRSFGDDMVTVGFEAGIAAQAFARRTGRRVDRWIAGTCAEEGLNRDRLALVQNCVAAQCWPEPAPEPFVLPIIPKREEMDYLPHPMLELAWTCRHPVRTSTGWEECGKCHTCHTMAAARAQGGPAAGPTEPAG